MGSFHRLAYAPLGLNGYFDAAFERGSPLIYTDDHYNFANNTYVPDATGTLTPTGGGTMELSSIGGSWEARIVGPTRRTVLSGQVTGQPAKFDFPLNVVSPIPIKVHLKPSRFPTSS
jgi:hypothetical protein